MTRILVAEDDQTLLENLVIELEMRGYDVIQATNGSQALDLLRTSKSLPDIIVSDIAMPDIDGFKFLEHVRCDSNWEHIPFLFLTAFNSPNSVRISKELGVDDYIIKPFNADDLVLAIENKMKRIRAFQSIADKNVDQIRQNLLHALSHEIRTPLTSIYGGTAMLSEGIADLPDTTIMELLELVHRGADRLNRFTDKALALIQIDSGYVQEAFNSSRLKYNVREIVQIAIGKIQNDRLVDNKPVKIFMDSDEDSILVEGIFEYLVMMIEEPLSNAVTFSPSNKAVKITITNNGETVFVNIQDHGSGIPEKDIDSVWTRFTQIDRDEYEQQGIGLGLSLVRDSAKIHGGYCQINSTFGHGTTFTLTLPIFSSARSDVDNFVNMI